MNILIDKFIVFILCMAYYVPNFTSSERILPALIVIILSSVFSYIEYNKIKLGVVVLYAVVCVYYPMFLYFVPVVFYDVIFSDIKWVWVPITISILININQMPVSATSFIIAFSGVAVLLKYRTVTSEKIRLKYYELRDNSKEMSLVLEEKNKELIEKQDYEINLATLNERNRIARDIHDNVGHMLSSSILQVGALLATVKEENAKESLKAVNSTLKNAMDSIRDSVHNLHEASIDLQSEIRALTDNFTFCQCEFSYDVQENPEKKLKNCFILIVKEALSNVIKHSNATKVTVSLLEHPGLYQLVIYDNGTKIRNKSADGIGLLNISDRVNAFKGNINISTDKGFRIFISIPK